MRLPGLARRAGWGVADQVISSLVNFGLGIAVARVGTLEEFGAYGLAFAAYLVAINLTRPASMEPLIIRFSSGASAAWRRAFAEATGALVVVGAGIGIVAIVLGVVLGGFTGAVFVLLGLGLPGLTLQDGWRLGFFAERRGRAAFFNDLTWAVVLFGAIGVMSATGNITAFGVIAAWVIGGNLAAILGFVQAATRPRPGSTRVWWRAQRDLGRPLVAEHVVTNVTSELTPFGMASSPTSARSAPCAGRNCCSDRSTCCSRRSPRGPAGGGAPRRAVTPAAAWGRGRLLGQPCRGVLAVGSSSWPCGADGCRPAR